MTSVRIIKHESVPQTGSYEVRFPDGRPSVYQHYDDDPGRRSITGKMTGAEALRVAKALARAEPGNSIVAVDSDLLLRWTHLLSSASKTTNVNEPIRILV